MTDNKYFFLPILFCSEQTIFDLIQNYLRRSCDPENAIHMEVNNISRLVKRYLLNFDENQFKYLKQLKNTFDILPKIKQAIALNVNEILFFSNNEMLSNLHLDL